MKPCEFSIRSTLFDRKRLLRITPECLCFEDEGSGDHATAFPVADIEAFRYGIRRISGWHFIIGRTYFLDIRGAGRKILRVRLHSLYGIRSKRLGEKYIQILSALIDMYFNDMAAHYTRLLRQGMSFELAGLPVTPEGIWLTALKQEIPWSRMDIHRYVFYFSIADRNYPDRYRIINYGHDWNAAVLLGVAENEMQVCRMSRG
jgi:hypothetical protein